MSIISIRIRIDFHRFKNWWIRLRRGVGCCDIFNLYGYQAPRLAKELKVFLCKVGSYPSDITFDQWKEYLGEMIWAFEFYSDDQDWNDKAGYERAGKGLALYAKYFSSLWL